MIVRVPKKHKRRPTEAEVAANYQKKPKLSPFHKTSVVPVEFFHDAANHHEEFLKGVVSTVVSTLDAAVGVDVDVNNNKKVDINLPNETDESGVAAEKAKAPAEPSKKNLEAATEGGGAIHFQASSVTVRPVERPVERFGLYNEAYLRKCYKELVEEISIENLKWETEQEETGHRLVEIRGSAGVGKSAFLAFLVAIFVKNGMDNFALFHSPKESDSDGSGVKGEVLCSVWINGEQKMHKEKYAHESTQRAISDYLPELDALFMDGCAMGFSCQDFNGMIYAVVSPSISTSGLRKAAPNAFAVLNMPAFSLVESIEVGAYLGVEQETIEENFLHMEGIIRYMLDRDSAKSKVLSSVKAVNPVSLTDMVATGYTDKEKEKNAVHALVLWITPKSEGTFDYRGEVSYELVSRYAEKLVAAKLATYQAQELEKLRTSMQPLGGAEGYAGALFEAYAIRRIRDGGDFVICSLEDEKQIEIKIPPMHGETDLVVINNNTLDRNTCSLEKVHVKG